jgi:hypothetical protein
VLEHQFDGSKAKTEENVNTFNCTLVRTWPKRADIIQNFSILVYGSIYKDFDSYMWYNVKPGHINMNPFSNSGQWLIRAAVTFRTSAQMFR